MKLLPILPLLLSLVCFSAHAEDVKFLAERHVERGTQCQDCHPTMPPQIVKGDSCQKCHGGYDKMADKTANLDINPHDSHVEDLDCTSCHRGHKRPVLICDECHEFTQLNIR